jgi:hypothetical protein
MDKTMQTVFIFTHLIMIGAVLSVLYIGLGMEAEETGTYPLIPEVWVSQRLNRFKAFGCRMKARVIVLSDHVSRLKIPNRLIRRSGHTL